MVKKAAMPQKAHAETVLPYHYDYMTTPSLKPKLLKMAVLTT